METILNHADFVNRVMKENLWPEVFTKRVIKEYLRFLNLSAHYNVAPSYEVDQIWHAHMLFSKDYMSVCKEFGKDYIHHDPVTSTSAKVEVDPYNFTLQRYRGIWGEPPADIWTPWRNKHMAYINLMNHTVIPVGDWKAHFKILLNYIKHGILGLVDRKKGKA